VPLLVFNVPKPLSQLPYTQPMFFENFVVSVTCAKEKPHSASSAISNQPALKLRLVKKIFLGIVFKSDIV
jgi:hypothetical protein